MIAIISKGYFVTASNEYHATTNGRIGQETDVLSGTVQIIGTISRLAIV
jgi:hypothetical protein